MGKIGIIGGTGLDELAALEDAQSGALDTPWGAASAAPRYGQLAGADAVFLARHGDRHDIPPHAINYRANLWALRELGVEAIVAVAAVGGIDPTFKPATLCIPDQVIDYTSGRVLSFYAADAPVSDFQQVEHVDFSWPYDTVLRAQLITAAAAVEAPCLTTGVYGATNGPRLETAAEIQRMAQDGCSMVGMTGMPEAILARELGIPFAVCAVSANWGAGLTEEEITMDEIRSNLALGMRRVVSVLRVWAQGRVEGHTD